MFSKMLAAATGLLALAGTAAAQDWKSDYKELVFATVPSENASGVSDRYADFIDYLSEQLGVPVTLRIAADYAAVIEAQKSGQVHIAQYGPASFARAVIIGAEVEPILGTINADGSKGYYSVLYVRKDDPYQSLQDLKGKKLCLVDPNSTSGFQAPTFFMREDGIDRETFFSESVVAGSHENAVITLLNGTCDAAVNWWNAENDSNYTRMVKKDMVKADQVRVVWKSPLLPSSPIAVLSDMPAELQQAIKTTLLESPQKAKEAFDKLSDGKDKGFFETTLQDYDPIIRMVRFNDEQKKRGS